MNRGNGIGFVPGWSAEQTIKWSLTAYCAQLTSRGTTTSIPPSVSSPRIFRNQSERLSYRLHSDAALDSSCAPTHKLGAQVEGGGTAPKQSTLRHSFITPAFTDGMATLDVARLVGTSIDMVEKYYWSRTHKLCAFDSRRGPIEGHQGQSTR